MDNQEETLVQRAVINEPMYDSKTGEFGKGYSPDNGKTFIVQEGNDGRYYHQGTDSSRISELVFDRFLMKADDGGIWEVTISNDGKLQTKKKESE
ncbi:hypothetical protein [Limosilactobacillus reuteri]|uniref:Uncharacterized protein n=1 Tax=Limosilactobacillus reuteri TaxID=1598 RepID=A0ABD6Y6Z5_LIMRT|nr:hypothetical protein [Limosilactobacillus reuteri]PWT37584.1 hypothetical protein DKZ35_04635 [Limosilactobacillus reuteri]